VDHVDEWMGLVRLEGVGQWSFDEEAAGPPPLDGLAPAVEQQGKHFVGLDPLINSRRTHLVLPQSVSAQLVADGVAVPLRRRQLHSLEQLNPHVDVVLLRP
jgi:hypothetical protein